MTAEIGASDLAWLDRQRREHFPPERNYLRAHLTMFHALAPSLEDEVVDAIKRHTATPPPEATISELINLGKGTAYRVRSAELETIRADLADHFAGMLTAQDSHGWRPHITIQNKVSPKEARALRQNLERDFSPRPLSITGIELHEYLGGPWRKIGRWPFRG